MLRCFFCIPTKIYTSGAYRAKKKTVTIFLYESVTTMIWR